MCKIDLIMHIIIILALLYIMHKISIENVTIWSILLSFLESAAGQQIPSFLQQQVCWNGDVSPIIDNKTNCPEGFLNYTEANNVVV